MHCIVLCCNELHCAVLCFVLCFAVLHCGLLIVLWCRMALLDVWQADVGVLIPDCVVFFFCYIAKHNVVMYLVCCVILHCIV